MMDDALRALLIRGSEDISTTGGNNAIATALADASANGDRTLRWFLTRIYCDFDAAVAAVATVTLAYTKGGTVVSEVYSPDFTNGEFVLPMLIHGDMDTDVSVSLAAGGAGIAGHVVISGFWA